MDERSLEHLEPEFRAEVKAVLEACATLGVEMRPFATLRDPWEQARLWRQSRTRETIEAKIAKLEREGAPYLAGVIDSVGPQTGAPVTGAIPGLSWHQWGEAVDCYWHVGGRAEWSTRKLTELSDGRSMNGYRLYGELAREQGLTSGGFWSGLKDWPHLQQRAGGVLDERSLREVDAAMEDRFPLSGTAAPRVIRTPRLDLVPASAENLRAELQGAAALAASLGVEIPESWPPPLYDRDAVEFTLARLEATRRVPEWWFYYFVARGHRGGAPTAVGAGGYKGPPDAGVPDRGPSATGTVEIGYSILPERQRQGLGTEAAWGLVERAFEDPRVERVIAETLPELVPSIGVLENVGFRFAGSAAGGGSEPEVLRYEMARVDR